MYPVLLFQSSLQEKFKYNNINEFDFLLLNYEIYKTIFLGLRGMRGHWLITLSPGAGTISLFYYPSKSKSPPLPVGGGGGGGGLHWLVHKEAVRQ
jgi:hypothetical protein